MEAMRDARPGMHEYELQADAEFVFKKHGALGASYFALIATGQNTYYTHYNRTPRRSRTATSSSSTTRPTSSTTSRTSRACSRPTASSRRASASTTTIYLQALPGADDVDQGARDADATSSARRSRRWTRSWRRITFTDPTIKTAATTFVEVYRNRRGGGLGHNVGLEVHDVGGLQAPTLEPGRIFTIEPQMRIEDEHLGVRLEDMILITETRLREPVRVRADRDRRHREADGRARPERRAGAHQEVARAATCGSSSRFADASDGESTRSPASASRCSNTSATRP